MQQTFFIRSLAGNAYLVNLHKKTIQIVHPLIPAIYSGYAPSDPSAGFDYYNRKLAYYKKYNIISEPQESTCKPLVLTAEKVEECIGNTNQIVFETTDRCNLKCRYCFYEDLYDTRKDKENSHFLSFGKARNVLDYIGSKLNDYNHSSGSTIYISFYGGEPLLNTALISESIDYCKKIESDLRKPKYTITTNGTLLSKHIDLLVENNFQITVTLDGNKANNSYRSFHNKKNSFDSIMYNLEKVKDLYPEYFKKNVAFNAVLHDKNSVEQIYDFYQSNFDTVPTLLELNNSGIKEDKVEAFNTIYRTKQNSIQKSGQSTKNDFETSIENPSYHSAAIFLHRYLWFVYNTYRHQILGEKVENPLSTGTCLPFSKKIFITANGKILPCEKISQEHVLGYVTEEGVSIDCQAIADKYNHIISMLSNQCKSCYKQSACEQCFFFTDTKNHVCHAFMNETIFREYLVSNISFIEKHPDDYHVIMKEILFN